MDYTEDEGYTTKHKVITALAYVALWASYIVIIAGIFASIDITTLFIWHPVCMVTAFVMFIGHGILAYRAPYVMKSLPLRRFTHAFLQHTGLFSALLGLVIIIANKVFIVQHPVWPSSPHSWMGMVVLGCMALQAIIGVVKMCLRKQIAVLKLHGYTGIVFWLGALVTICLGVWQMQGRFGNIVYAVWAVLSLLAITVVVSKFALPWRVEPATTTTHETRPILRRTGD